MLQSSVLHSKLKSFDYYVNKLPMFLQQSEGFIEHYRIWYDLLVGEINTNNTGVVGVGDTLFNLLNIFDQKIDDAGNITNHYLTYLNSLPNSDEGYAADILDKIGSLFGVKRSFEVQYDNVEGTQKKYIYLDNHDFLILIKAQIVKNYCEGTYEQIKSYYESVGLYVYVTTSSEPATSNIYLAYFTGDNEYKPSENVQAMFFAGLLTIESMGIVYRRAFVNLDELLLWSKAADESSEPVLEERGWSNDEVGNGGIWVV